MADSPSTLSVEQTVVASNTATVQVSQASTDRNGVTTTVTELVNSKVCSQSVTSLPRNGSDPNRRQSASSINPINRLAKHFRKLRSKPSKTKEQPSPDGGDDASKTRPWSFITGRISSTKTKIQKTFFSNGEVLTTTQKQQTDSSSVLFTPQPDVYRPPDLPPDRTELDYLKRTQKEAAAAAALRNLVNQDADLSADSDGETTTESVHDTVMPGSQSPERAIVENEELASTLAAAATDIAVRSRNLPPGTVSVHSEVLVNDDLMSRTGSLRVKTTRVPYKAPTVEDAEESGEKTPPSLPNISDFPRLAAERAEAEKARKPTEATTVADTDQISHPLLHKKKCVDLQDLQNLQNLQQQIRLQADPKSKGKRFVDSYPSKSNKKPCRKEYKPVLSSIEDEDEEEEPHQPKTALPTPPESPKSSISKDRIEVSTELPRTPNSPKDTNLEPGTFPLTIDISLHSILRLSSDIGPVANFIDAEGSRILRGSPPRSDAMAKFVRFHQERMAIGRKMDENAGDEEQRSEMRRELRRRIAVDDFGEFSGVGVLD
jgi:hypothetical protein